VPSISVRAWPQPHELWWCLRSWKMNLSTPTTEPGWFTLEFLYVAVLAVRHRRQHVRLWRDISVNLIVWIRDIRLTILLLICVEIVLNVSSLLVIFWQNVDVLCVERKFVKECWLLRGVPYPAKKYASSSSLSSSNMTSLS
jgi:hypothetical protein